MINFDPHSFSFSMEINSNKYNCNFPFAITELLDNSELDEYEVICFKSICKIPENNVVNCFYQKKGEQKYQVGNLISSNSLISVEHDYANKQYFIKLAYIIYYATLSIYSSSELGEIDLSDLFEDNSVFFIYEKKKINNFERLYPFFYTLGLSKKSTSIFSLQDIEAKWENIFTNNNSLKIKYVSEDVNESYVNDFFSTIIFEHGNEITLFSFLYQFIELFIDMVLENIIVQGTYLIRDRDISVNDLKTKISNYSSEEKRIVYLMSLYIDIQDKTLKENMIIECEKLECIYKNEIFKNEPKEITKLAERIYKVRNLFVHNLRIIYQHQNNLKNINRLFLQIIIEALYSYRQLTKEEIRQNNIL